LGLFLPLRLREGVIHAAHGKRGHCVCFCPFPLSEDCFPRHTMNVDNTVPARRGWITANLMGQLSFGLLAMTICLPSMQSWPEVFGASQAQVQLSFSGFVAAYGILQLVYGAVSDRMGRGPVLLAGLVLAFAGSAMAAFATDLATLTLARVVQGAGSAAGMVVGRAMVQDLFKGPERTRVMAFVGVMFGFCPPTAMLIGGQIHAHLGWQAVFLLMAALALCLMVSAWLGLPDIRSAQQVVVAPGAGQEGQAGPAGGSGGSYMGDLLQGYGRLLREPSFLLYVVILAMTSSTFYAFLTGAPLVLNAYQVRPEHIGFYLMSLPVAYIMGNLLTTRLIQTLGDRRLMLAGQIFSTAGIVALLLTGLAGWHTPWALSWPVLLLGIGHGLMMPPTLTGTVGLIPALAGSAAAVAGLMQQLTGALGGFVVGLVHHAGPVNLAAQMLAWTLCGFAAQIWLQRLDGRKKKNKVPGC
jgi:DHA1 family bicyclomycin/chloramphenicol resistance-like MFS transporter